MTLLLTQMAIVLLITVACGWLALKVGQARVIGEIIGGILVGPSVFGRFAPHLSASLFPPSSLGPFETLSTVGLVLFLFLIGMELDYEHLARQRATAVMASGMSILLPFGMAALLAHSLRAFSGHRHEHHRLPGAGPHPRRAQSAGNCPGHHRHPLCRSG
jgi:Kef-type K+ transport system membrane component KefB